MLVEHSVAGWRAITMVTDLLSATVLPDRGAEIHALVDRAAGVDVLFHAPWGLAPPGAPPREGAGGHAFLERYAGGWQELFPSCDPPCRYRGRTIPFHGEVATRAWAVEAAAEAALDCTITCETAPFRLERRMHLADDRAALVLDETVTNVGDEPWELTWGHHIVLGPPFLQAGCRLEPAARTLETGQSAWEETARLALGQRRSWPDAALAVGGEVDLSHVPGPEIDSHDDVYLTDLLAGEIAVVNPLLGRTVRVRFDPGLFRWIVAWQPYGGAHTLPLRGTYALGIEPWVARVPLAEAAAAGEAITLEAGGRLTTTLEFALEDA